MCKTYVATHAKVVERERILKFPHGLNQEYDPIKVQILRREKLLPLSEVFFIVQGEENLRVVMLNGVTSNTSYTMTT